MILSICLTLCDILSMCAFVLHVRACVCVCGCTWVWVCAMVCAMWVQQWVSKVVEADPDERRVALIALAKVAS